MIINHNISALNTFRQLNANNTAASKSLQKLSSGLRINSASDDAAGLAISEKMRGQISGLDQASRNAQDGISLIQTAEGGLSVSHSMLQTMRELAVQSASDTNTNADRAALDQEFQQLKNAINDIANKTAFNGINLLKGTTGGTATATATGLAAGITVTADNTASAGTIHIAPVTALPGVGGTNSVSFIYTDDNGISNAAASGTVAAGSQYNGTYYLKASGSDLSAMTFSLVNKDGGATVASTGALPVSAGGSKTLDFGNYGKLDVTLGTSTSENLLGIYLDGTTASVLHYTISDGIDHAPSAAWDAGAAVAGAGSADLVVSDNNGFISASATGSAAGGSQYNGTYYLRATGTDMFGMTFSLVDGGGTTVALRVLCRWAQAIARRLISAIMENWAWI